MNVRRTGFLAISATGLFLLTGMDCPDDHPLATSMDTVSFAETSLGNGFRTQTVSSGASAPHLPFELMVNVSSDQPVFEGDAQAFVTFRCAFGNTKTFEVTFTENADSSLTGVFSRAANVSSTGECIGDGGQREQVTWSVQFVRPQNSTQMLDFDYSMSWRQANVGN